MNIKDIGVYGEKVTADYLKEQGFIIFKRNYHSRFGEIDIIAEKDNLLLFVEVKTRGENQLALGREAVDYNKQNKIKATANDFLRKTKHEYTCRFDVSEVTYKETEQGIECDIYYITDAFY